VIVCIPGCPSRIWMEFLRAALAMVEAPVVYAVHIVAPLLLLYAINQV
jgi:hypothetical protein